MKVKPDNFDTKIEYFILDCGGKKNTPGKWKQEELTPSFTKLESKLVKDNISESEILMYGFQRRTQVF